VRTRAGPALALLLGAGPAFATTPCPPAGPADPRVFPPSNAAAPRNAIVRVQQGWSNPVVMDNLQLFDNGVPVTVEFEKRGFEGDQWRILKPTAPLDPGSAEVRSPPQVISRFDVIAADDGSPPTFAGITGVDALGADGCKPARLRFRLGAMQDDITAQERLVLHFYLATAEGRQDFSTPVIVPASEPELHPFNAPLTAGETYYVVAGLLDEAGNESQRSDEWRVEFTGGAGCNCGEGGPAAALPLLLLGVGLAAALARPVNVPRWREAAPPARPRS
jgi:hypothetical protein